MSSSSPTKQSPVADSRSQIHERYAISSTWEFVLTNKECVKGEVYCADSVAGVVVLRENGSDVRMVAVSSIQESKRVNGNDDLQRNQQTNMGHTKKALEEREKRAIRLAQESLRHLNPKASPKGQAIFDRLLKACNEVAWKGESIIVLNQIRVDPPYTQHDCKLLLSGSAQSGGSLDRVQKIVASAAM